MPIFIVQERCFTIWWNRTNSMTNVHFLVVLLFLERNQRFWGIYLMET